MIALVAESLEDTAIPGLVVIWRSKLHPCGTPALSLYVHVGGMDEYKFTMIGVSSESLKWK